MPAGTSGWLTIAFTCQAGCKERDVSKYRSVHLEQNVFQCFDAKCAAKGDVIDLWAAVKKLPLRAAALDLVQTFHLEPAPRRTEKRNG